MITLPRFWVLLRHILDRWKCLLSEWSRSWKHVLVKSTSVYWQFRFKCYGTRAERQHRSHHAGNERSPQLLSLNILPSVWNMKTHNLVKRSSLTTFQITASLLPTHSELWVPTKFTDKYIKHTVVICILIYYSDNYINYLFKLNAWLLVHYFYLMHYGIRWVHTF